MKLLPTRNCGGPEVKPVGVVPLRPDLEVRNIIVIRTNRTPEKVAISRDHSFRWLVTQPAAPKNVGTFACGSIEGKQKSSVGELGISVGGSAHGRGSTLLVVKKNHSLPFLPVVRATPPMKL